MKASDFYFASTREMALLDKLAVEHGLEIRQMMELAGWHMLELFDRLSIKRDKKVTVVVGKGNKGGDGLCAARHLINHGFTVSVVLLSQDLKPDPKHQLELLKKMNVKHFDYSNNPSESEKVLSQGTGVIIDALIGYNLSGAPRGLFAQIIRAINRLKSTTIISYDLPTGINPTTGEIYNPSIKADATLTLGLFKKLFNIKESKQQSGEVYLADLGIPDRLYNKLDPKLDSPFRGTKRLTKL